MWRSVISFASENGRLVRCLCQKVSEIEAKEYSYGSITTTKTARSGAPVSASSRYAYDVNGDLVRTDTTLAMETVNTTKRASVQT